MIGRTLDGQYRLDGILGEGAMGVVFEQPTLPSTRLSPSDDAQRDVCRARRGRTLQREAKLWSQLNHPSIAQVFDFGLSDDMPYLVMELIEATSSRMCSIAKVRCRRCGRFR